MMIIETSKNVPKIEKRCNCVFKDNCSICANKTVNMLLVTKKSCSYVGYL